MTKSITFEKALNQNVAFTAKRMFDLFLLINEQAATIYQQIGINFPVNVSSTVLFLSVEKDASLTEIAKALGLSHQLIAQRVKTLLKLKLIEKHPAANDKRKVLYSLTPEGQKQSAILNQYCKGAENAFNHLSAEVGVDIHGLLNQAVDALHHTPLLERYKVASGKQE